jgi:hypothetical protein
MSTSNDAHSSNHITSSRASQNAGQPQNLYNTAVQDCNHTRLRSKTFASVVAKIWTAIKDPRNVLAKRLKSKKRLQKLALWRTKEQAVPGGKRKRSREPLNVAGPTSSSVPATAIFEETPSESVTCPSPPLPITTASESSISLPSQTDATPPSASVRDIRHSPSIISFIDLQFRSDGLPGTAFSEVSTLQNSTFVNEDFSRDFSEARLSRALEPQNVTVLDATHATPAAIASQPTRPSTPRPRPSFRQGNVPSSNDQENPSTTCSIHSSPASEVDFQGMGGHFEESRSLH